MDDMNEQVGSPVEQLLLRLQVSEREGGLLGASLRRPHTRRLALRHLLHLLGLARCSAIGWHAPSAVCL